MFGDPANTDLTRMAHVIGWPGRQPLTRFDVLPLLIQEPGETVTWHELPSDAVLEVPVEHPGYRWFTNLGLRWHAVPVISDMYLSVGGIRYPAAPFNGWYMGTEIGSRNLGDETRYCDDAAGRRTDGMAHLITGTSASGKTGPSPS